MTAERRAQQLVRSGDLIVDEAAMAAYLADIDRGSPRPAPRPAPQPDFAAEGLGAFGVSRDELAGPTEAPDLRAVVSSAGAGLVSPHELGAGAPVTARHSDPALRDALGRASHVARSQPSASPSSGPAPSRRPGTEAPAVTGG